MEMTFREGATEYIVQAFGLDVNDEGYIVYGDSGERLTDGYGVPIKEEDFGSLIPFENHGFSVNEDGVVVDHKKNPISLTPEQMDDTGEVYDAIVPFVTDDGKQAGILRDTFPATCDFVDASVDEEYTEQPTL